MVSIGQSDHTKHVQPAFAPESADITLCSEDNVHFRVHSVVLGLGSGWFRTLLSLPQVNNDATEPLRMSESSEVARDLLAIISGQDVPPLDDIEHIAALLHAAEKYEMHGAMSVIRLALVAPSLLERHPVRAYGLACRYGWMEEAKLASSKAIGIDILSEDALPELHTLDAPHLTKLMLLHRRRRDALRRELDSSVFYANNAPGRCSRCQSPNGHVEWLRFKAAVLTAIEQTPEQIANSDILHSQQLRTLVGVVCRSCQVALYNAEATILNLKEILQGLPTTVEFS